MRGVGGTMGGERVADIVAVEFPWLCVRAAWLRLAVYAVCGTALWVGRGVAVDLPAWPVSMKAQNSNAGQALPPHNPLKAAALSSSSAKASASTHPSCTSQPLITSFPCTLLSDEKEGIGGGTTTPSTPVALLTALILLPSARTLLASPSALRLCRRSGGSAHTKTDPSRDVLTNAQPQNV